MAFAALATWFSTGKNSERLWDRLGIGGIRGYTSDKSDNGSTSLPGISRGVSILTLTLALSSGLDRQDVVAQATGTIRGLVIALETGRPLPDTRVTVVGTDIETSTDSTGSFELTHLTAGSVVLRFERIELARLTERITVQAGIIIFRVFDMPSQMQVLDAIGVTVRRDQEGGSNAVVEGEALDTHESLNRILDGVSGVELVRTSGEVGAGYYVRIRGVNSLTFASLPVVFIDGVRVHMNFRSSGSSLDLISPSQVGRVEVLRGAAAGARYGPDASNGVILITTKRGR